MNVAIKFISAGIRSPHSCHPKKKEEQVSIRPHISNIEQVCLENCRSTCGETCVYIFCTCVYCVCCVYWVKLQLVSTHPFDAKRRDMIRYKIQWGVMRCYEMRKHCIATITRCHCSLLPRKVFEVRVPQSRDASKYTSLPTSEKKTSCFDTGATTFPTIEDIWSRSLSWTIYI